MVFSSGSSTGSLTRHVLLPSLPSLRFPSWVPFALALRFVGASRPGELASPGALHCANANKCSGALRKVNPKIMRQREKSGMEHRQGTM